MMNFNLNTMFQSQIARAATFFKGQERLASDSDEAKDKRRMVADRFIASKQAMMADQATTNTQMK